MLIHTQVIKANPAEAYRDFHSLTVTENIATPSGVDVVCTLYTHG